MKQYVLLEGGLISETLMPGKIESVDLNDKEIRIGIR